MTAPSNANTSGLVNVGHIVWWKAGGVSYYPEGEAFGVSKSCRVESLVTAASAQARIAELERDKEELARTATEWTTEAHERLQKVEAAEARADRLAKGLKDAEESARRYARCYEPSSDGRNTFLMLADHIHALQQEG